MKKNKFFVLLVIGVFAFSLLTVFVYNRLTIYKIMEIGTKVKIGDHIGLNADSDSLNFGTLLPNTEGIKSITITNQEDYPMEIIISNSGQIEHWIQISDNNFILDSGKNKSVTFTVTPSTKEIGSYNGIVMVVFKRVFFS